MLMVVVLGLALAWLFWEPLFKGGGFVGGDVYSYYLPQKVFFADRLRSGEFPLWHNLTGYGYPLVGESQTGPFYPFPILAYRFLPANAAYSLIHVLHYVLAFSFAALYARSFGLGKVGAALAGVIYAYAWFPARSCVEWAIIGGAWLPAALWCAESFLRTHRWRFAYGQCAVLSVQLLAGHFVLAFITQLVLLAYVPLRLWFAPEGIGRLTSRQKWLAAAMAAAALALAFSITAVQLLPTLQLRGRSQRASAGEHHELEFGSIPEWYWLQAVAPFQFYSPLQGDRDAQLQQFPPLGKARTNQVEAHLYFGLAPLILAVWGTLASFLTGDRKYIVWVILGVLALVYTSGRLLAATQYLPGFSFFQGPGRYGVVTTLAVGLLAGKGADALWQARIPRGGLLALFPLAALASLLSTLMLVWDVDQLSETVPEFLTPLRLARGELTSARMTGAGVVCIVTLLAGLWLCRREARATGPATRFNGKRLLLGCLFAVTVLDLWVVSRLVGYTALVDDPPINYRETSEIRRELLKERGRSPEPVRLLAPGGNLPNVLGAASFPVYLTFGPAAYIDEQSKFPSLADPDPNRASPAITVEQRDWLRRAGFTHVVSFQALDEVQWSAQLLYQGPDPFMGRAWNRGNAPFYLYELNHEAAVPFGRAYFENPSPHDRVAITEYAANRVTIATESPEGGRLVLTDLTYPGWKVALDGAPVKAHESDGLFRAVDVPAGKHTVVWTYRPASLYWGAGISIVGVLSLLAIAHVRFRHPSRLGFLDEPVGTTTKETERTGQA